MLVLSFAAAAGAQTTRPAPTAPATGFLYKTIELEGETYAYSVFVPPDYTPDKAWPAILFLHGSGERGTDGFLQTDVGIGHALRLRHQLIPAVVVMPQCRPNEFWTGTMSRLALRCLEQTSREYRLDRDRLYLTGLSLGGHGVWFIAAEHPQIFAALVPICGFAELGDPTGVARQLAPRLVGTPAWAFHGALDASVPAEKSREMVAAIRQAGGEAYYSELPERNHFIWDTVYGRPELWRWLFDQRRGQKPASAPSPLPGETTGGPEPAPRSNDE